MFKFILFSSIFSSLVFSIIEYFSYLNLWLIILFLFLCLFFLIFSSCQLLISSLYCSGAVFEFSLILVSFLFIVIIISPALIILLDYEIIIVPSFIVFVCGYQWAWTFSGSLSSYFSSLLSSSSSFSSLSSLSAPPISGSFCSIPYYSLYNSFYSLDHYLLSSFYLTLLFFKFSLFNSFYYAFNSIYKKSSSLFIPFFFLFPPPPYIYYLTFNLFDPLFNWFYSMLYYFIFSIGAFYIFDSFSVFISEHCFELLIALNSSYSSYSSPWHLFNSLKTRFNVTSFNLFYPPPLLLLFYDVYSRLINTFSPPYTSSFLLSKPWIRTLLFFSISSKCWMLLPRNSDLFYLSFFYLFSSLYYSTPFYFWNTNCILLLAYLSTLRFIVFSYDVIHSFGLFSFGIKMDCIPGKFNVTSTIRILVKGEHRGLCYELCGYGHSTMLINSRTL